MKLQNIFRLAIMAGVLCSAQAYAGNIAVVIHPSSKLESASLDEVKRLFLDKKKSIQGVKLSAVAQNSSQAIRVVFDEDVLGKDPSRSKAYWSRLIFTAKGMPPPELDSSSAIVKWVSAHPNAIGYVDMGSVNESVKLLVEL
ncbi:MAG: phosphate ABC transporter substrate-binding protein [Gammaproteobacteria bacterium]|nr:phosphate ABC transporter substrate-binding protein [Gammaproteobacteria bacterium]